MLKSDHSPNSSNAALPKADGRVSSGKAFDGLMSSFTIKTPKPWTMVQGFEDQHPSKRPGRAVKEGSIQSNPAERGARPRQLVPRMPAPQDPPPYSLGARRASASGDRAWIESYGLVPNHNFKATKIIQHYPSAGAPANPSQSSSPIESTGRRSSPTHGDHIRSNSVPIVVGASTAHVDTRNAHRNLTFHSLEFDNGMMRAAPEGQGASLKNATTFVASEYQHQLAPVERPAKRSRSSDIQPSSGVETSIEAAQLLLDFTKIANA